MSMLQVQGLNKSFFVPAKRQSKTKGIRGAIASVAPVLKDVSFNVEQGELFTLLGPSGCGKSTTLRSIAGLETPDEGKIVVGEHTVYSSADRVLLAPNARQLSMVFQSYAIWPHLNVFKNVSFPLEVGKNKLSKKQIQERVEAALEAVQLNGLSDRSAVKLSGGQQQRLALARSLVTEPELVLLDEPLSNLDAKLRETMRIELKRLQKTLGLTSVYVTHDQNEALAMSSRIAVMSEGQVVQIGKPRDIYENPTSRFVAEFVGNSNLVEGTVRQLDGDVAVIETRFGNIFSTNWQELLVGDEILMMIRPEDIHLKHIDDVNSPDNGWSGEVSAGAYLGEAIDYVMDIGGVDFKVKSNEPSSTGWVGTRAFANIAAARVLVLPPERLLG